MPPVCNALMLSRQSRAHGLPSVEIAIDDEVPGLDDRLPGVHDGIVAPHPHNDAKVELRRTRFTQQQQ